MPFASTTPGAKQPLLASKQLGYGRDPLAPTKDAVTADGYIAILIDAASIGFCLKAAHDSRRHNQDPYLPVGQLEQATFDWQAALASDPGRICTVVLTNTVTGY